MTNPVAIPLVLTDAGAQPTDPSVLRQAILNGVAAISSGYTANLPGTLIEDILSTDMGALVTIDQARVDTINSLYPYSANDYILSLLGAQLGIPQGQATNANVNVVFSGSSGQVVPQGTIVSDGIGQYVSTVGAIISASGSTVPVNCVANSSSIVVPALPNAVTQVLTSFPSGVTITCNNPNAGIAALPPQTSDEYRSQLMLAYAAPVASSAAFILSTVLAVTGVNPLLTAVKVLSTGYQVIAAGGSPQAIGYAILTASADIYNLLGSQVSATRNVTVSVVDGINTYSIVYVSPPAQVVTGSLTWTTSITNFSQASLVNATATPVVVSYLNSIPVGNPINLIEMMNVFINSVESIIQGQDISNVSISININGSSVTPISGTQLIASDPESYFSTASNALTITMS